MFRFLLFLLFVPPISLRGEWSIARSGHAYVFPADHYAHREFKTEWWYFTGHLKGSDGRDFGYQLTFFRQGILAPGEESEASSRFVRPAFHFAHFTVSDLRGEHFRFEQKLSRGAFGEAGDAVDPEVARVAWIEGWELTRNVEGFHLKANMSGAALELDLVARKAPVIHGADGISRKSEGEGNASHYYSITRMESSGKLTLDGEEWVVVGESWFDREWGSSQLGDDQVGWDWFSLQFDDGSELMLYRLRRDDGSTDPFSGGTLIAPDGTSEALKAGDFMLAPGATWKSGATGATYPVRWQVALRARGIELDVTAAMDAQELAFTEVAYWEGAVFAKGKRDGKPLSGRGYLEMTGYAGSLGALR